MLEKLERLIVELTSLAVETRLYLVRASGLNPITVASAPAEPNQKTPRARKEKAEAAVALPAAEVTLEESSAALITACKAYVMRFQKSTPDGRVRANAILKEKFGVGKIADLEHPQRLKFIGLLKDDLAAYDMAHGVVVGA